MRLYRDELTRLEIDKQELTNAEKLFNLPIIILSGIICYTKRNEKFRKTLCSYMNNN